MINKSRRKPNIKNLLDLTIEDAVIKLAIDEPAWGQTRVSNELRKQTLLKLVFAGTLVKPIDWFDLIFHGLPWMILLTKIVVHFKKAKSTYVDQN